MGGKSPRDGLRGTTKNVQTCCNLMFTGKVNLIYIKRLKIVHKCLKFFPRDLGSTTRALHTLFNPLI
jgi:hypothetical protein